MHGGTRVPWRVLLVAGALLLISAIAAVGAASAKTVYVDDSFGADNPPIHQWRSIQMGSYDAAPGDTVSIANGVYYENLTFWNSSVSYEGESRDGVQVIFNTSAQHVILVRGANIALRNMTVQGGNNGIASYNSGSHNGTIDNVTVQQSNYAGIQVNGGSDWLVQNVEVLNVGALGLYVVGTSYNHTVSNITVVGTGAYEGIQFNGADNSRLDQVYISNAGRSGVYFYFAERNHLSNFTINGSGDRGINLYYGHETWLTDGWINNSNYDGIYSAYSDNGVVSNVVLTNHSRANYFNVHLNQNVHWTFNSLNATGPTPAIDVSYSNTGSILFYSHQIQNSVWNGVPIIYLSDQAGGSYTGPASQVFLVNVTGFTLNVTSPVTGTDHAVVFVGVHNSTVLGLNSTGNKYTNLLLRDSWDNEVGNFTQQAVSAAAWAGLYVYGGGWNRFVGNNWTSSATIEIAGELATGASNNSFEGLVCHLWNQCVRIDADAPDNAVRNSTFDGSSNVCFYVWYGERYLIENSTFDVCNTGIYAYQAGPGVIDNVSVWDAGNTAIYFYYSSGARITSTFITRPNYYGVYAITSNHVQIENSIIENATRTDYGLIHLSNSHYWTMHGVALARATNPIDINWANTMPIANAQHDIDTSNTYDGLPIVWFTNATGATYDGPASLFVAVNSTLLNVTLQSAMQDTYVGGFVLETNNSTVRGLNATNGYHNLLVLRGFDNTFANFTQFGERSTSGGLYIWGSHNNVFKDSVWANASRSRYGAYVVGDSANNLFQNVTVTGWNLGFYLNQGSGTNFIEWSTFSGNNYGMELYYNAPVVITNCTLVSNFNSGLFLYYSSGSRIENTTLTDNTYYQIYGNNAHYGWLQDSVLANSSAQDYGLLYLSNSRYWTLRGNSFSGMSHPIDINLAYNSPVSNAQHDIDTSNTVAGQPIVYFTNATGASYTGPVGFFGAVNSTQLNATFTTPISGLTYGGWMVEANNSTFSGLNISGGYIDLFLVRSHDNTISNYTQPSVRQNTYGGLLIWDSDRNLVKDSSVVHTGTVQFTGIELRGTSEGNTLYNVTVSGYNIGLIGDQNSAPNRVEWSTFSGNNYGIELYYAAPLVITNSSFVGNSNSGIYFYYSSGTRIENSTLAGNTYYQIYANNGHYGQIIDSRLENQTAQDRGLLYLLNSRYWTLRGTAFSNGNFPIDTNMAYNAPIANLQHDIDTSNTVDGQPIVYFTNSTGGSYTGPVGFFGAVNSTLLDVTFTNGGAGLYHTGWILETNNSTFRGINASGGYVNVYIARSHDNTLANYSQRSVRQGTYGGLLLWDSNRNTIRDSVLANQTGAYTAIEFRGSSGGNVLLNVTVTGYGTGLITTQISGANSIEWSTFSGNSYGVEFYYSVSQTITNSSFVSNSNTGLYLYFSSSSHIDNSTFAGNYYYQIFANNGHYTRIQDSRLENNTLNYGLIYLANSRYWTLRNVSFANAYLPIDPNWGFTMNVADLMHDIDPSNTFNGKPIVWFANASGSSYTGPVGFLVVANSTNLDLTFTGQTETVYYGAIIHYADNSTFRNLNVSSSTYNVRVTFSTDNLFVNFSQSSEPSSSYGGITFYDSHRNVIDGGAWVNVTGTNSAAYIGWGSSYNMINNVTCVQFYMCAEIYQAGAWNTVRNSSLSGTYAGVYAYYSDRVQVLNNTINAGTYSVHFTTGTTNAFVFHNNLYQPNGRLLDQGTNNVFDGGYPAGGNFWSNGSHTDNYGGASQSTGGPDGIVDTAQGIYGPTLDYYPLSEPWPPQIALLFPANNSFIQPGALLYFSVSRYFDNINYSIDNGSQANFSDPFTLNTSAWSQGPHWVRIFCTDATNTSLGAYFVFTVDSTAPTITAVTPSPGSFNDVGTPFNFSVTDAYLASNATWDNGSGGNAFSAPWSISTVGWTEGTWNITINAWDLAGNFRQQTFLYRLDSTFPVITLSSPANNSVVGVGTVINLDVTDTFLASVTWSNGGPFTSLSSPYDIDMSGWSSGTYNITVVALDAAFHQTVRVYTFTLDSIPPQITLVSPANNSAVTPGTVIDIEIVELNLQSVTFDVGFGVSTFASPYNISTFGWSDGWYDVEVWADDTAGNSAYALFHIAIDTVAPTVTPPNLSGGGIIAPGTVLPFNITDPTLANVTFSNGSGDVPLSGPPFGVDTSGWADGNYTITVNATDGAGHTTSVDVNVTIDGTPPAVSLLTPTNGSIISAGTPIELDINDANLNWTTWDNGTGGQAFTDPYNISTAGWADGVYNITIVAEDLAGNQETVVVQVIIDSGPPSITAPSFTPGDVITPGTVIDFNITDPTLQNAGWVTDFGSGTLTDPFDLDTAGWPEGTTNLSVWATDGAGNTAWFNVTVTVDDTPPAVSLNAPGNGSVVPSSVTIDIEIVELNLASAFWDNGSGTNTFSSPFDISTLGWLDGTYNISVYATDLAGHTGFGLFVVTVDNTPPQITLNSPSDGSSINAGDVIDLDIVEAFLANATWDNGSGQVVFSSPFEINTTGWAGGTYLMQIIANDLANNYAWLNFTVTIDTAPPSIALVSPANGSVIVAGSTIVFNITDTDLVSTSWDDGSGAQSFATDFEVSTTGWSDGTYLITVNATDGASNSVSQWFVFIIDSTAPSVTLNSPASGAYVPAGTTLDLSVSDTNLDSVVWDNGGSPSTLASPFDISTSGWADGAYSVRVRAQDLAGLVTWNNFTINIDSTPPAISLTTPSNGSYIQAGTTLDLSIVDANLDTASWDNGSGSNSFSSPFDISTSGWADGTVTITVTATDLAGNTAQQDYQWTIDTTLPAVNLLSPSAGAVVLAGTTIDLSVSDTNLAAAGWMNATTGGTLTAPWDISTAGWPDGGQSISVFADDLAGNRRWLNFSLTIDSTPPSISLSAPANNSYIRAGTPIQLNISDLTLVSATWNNVTSGDVPFATNFTVPTDGWIDRHYNVTVRAVDGAGSLTTRVFHYILDSTPPQLVLVSPANDSWFRAGAIIDYVVADANPITANVTGNFTPITGTWDFDTTGWPDNDYNVVIVVVDDAGNNATLRNTFHIDSAPPVVTPNTPGGSAIRAGSPISFQVLEPNLVTVVWRNATGTFVPFVSNFSIPTNGWIDGLYLLTVQAADRAGNVVNRSFNYTVDSTDPVITVLSPGNVTYLRSNMSIVFRLVDLTPLNVTTAVRGVPTSLLAGPNGTLVLPLDLQGEGTLDVFMTATDAAGNAAQFYREFIVDNTAPILPSSLVSMSGDEDVPFTLSASVVDTFTPQDFLQWKWQFDNQSRTLALITLTGNNATWNFTEPGTYNIDLNVTDPAGNSNNTTYTIVIFDTTPPDVNNWDDYIQWPEDTEFTLSIQVADNSNQTLNYTWTVPGTNLTANSSNISWIFPTPGVYNVTLIVTDPSGNAVAQYALFNITDITPPEIELIGPTVVDLLQQANFTVNVMDNDARFGYANWSYVWQFTNGSGPQPGGTARNSTFFPRTNQTVTVAVTVLDASGNSNFLTRQLLVNVPPLVVGSGPPEASVDEDWEWTVDTFDPETGGPVPITIVFGPDGLEVDGSTLHWRPAANQTGPQNITIELDDGTTKVQKTFTLYVGDPSAAAGNHAPYWTSVPLQDARVNYEYVYSFEARDDDAGQTLQYFLSFASEEGFRLDPNARQLRWFPPWHPVGDEPFMRNVTISLMAFDGYAYANQTFVIRFRNPPNQWPVHFGSATVGEVGLNESVSIRIANYWSDPDDPINLLNFVINGTYEEREAVAGKVDWYVDRSNPLDPQLIVTAKAIGTYSFKIVARDPSGGTSENNTIEVTVGSGLPPGEASTIPWWLILIIVAGLGVGLAGVAVAVRRSRAATAAAQSATRTAETALETASRIPEAVVQPAEPLPAKGTKKDTYVIEALFIIYDDGRLIYSKTDISEVKFEDPELVASMFSAVQSFIKDSFQQTGELDRLGFGENTIMIERANKVFMAAVIFGQPTEDLRDGMKETLTTIENAYAGIIEDWDGSTTSLEGIEGYVLPFLATTTHLTRKDVELALTEKGVKMVSQLEFFQGFVRLKCGVKNDTDSVITKLTVSIDYNEDVLRLHHIEPDSYKRQGSEVQMGVLNPQEKASLAYYFDPQICTESMIDGIARYRDSKGAVHSVNMKTRKAEVVCPIFFTKEHANTAMLKRLVEGELDQRDSKVYSVEALADGMSWKDLFSLLKDVVLSHDVHLVRDFIREDPYQAEVWFYGETKVKNYKIVIRASVHEEAEKMEFFAASTQIPAITGLLAEFNHTLQSMAKSKHPGLFLVPEFDEAVKEAVEKKSLMPKMEDAELESGETEQ